MTNTNFTAPTPLPATMDLKNDTTSGERPHGVSERPHAPDPPHIRELARGSGRSAASPLIELLVTMVAGMVVLSALYTILDVTLRQTSNTFTRLDSTGRGNAVMAGIENEILHSACVANSETPVQGGANGTQVSDANDLVFLSQYGDIG